MKNNKISLGRIAKICNVSPGTVDRAIHNRKGISAKTKEKILSVAREYGYRPNKSGLVGIIVFDLHNEYFSELIMHIEKELRNSGYYSLVMFSDKNKETEKECIEAMYDAGVDGIVLCPINYGREFSEYLRSWKIPVVTVGNKVDGVNFLGIDDFSAMKDLTEYVISKKYNKIIYYSPNVEKTDCNIYAQRQRYSGFKEAVESCTGVEWVNINSEEDLKLSVNEHTAIIASTDFYALKAMFSGAAEGCFVVGFDDIPSIYKYKIPLVSVSYDKVSCAKSVVDYIVNKKDFNDKFIEHKITYKNHL